MKLLSVHIKNFRCISDLTLDFRDDLGRPRDLTMLLGPNGAGKTTILDAIYCCLGINTELVQWRTGFELSAWHVVRKGAYSAEVSCQVRFDDEEREATRQLFKLAQDSNEVPDVSDVSVKWQYPDHTGQSNLGSAVCEPDGAWTLLKGRRYAYRLLQTEVIKPDLLGRTGRVVLYDQQRTLLGQQIPDDIHELIATPGPSPRDVIAPINRPVTDPRKMLIGLAVQSKMARRSADAQEGHPDPFQTLKEAFGKVCAPHKLIDVVRSDAGFEIIFGHGSNEYRYEGLSGGEQMVLLFLLDFVYRRLSKSIVLVDELELHQHPSWQTGLLYRLQKAGNDNQLIVTTHSRYLRDVAPGGSAIVLADVDTGAVAAGQR